MNERKAPGQVLVLVALLLAILIALVLGFLEWGWRLNQRNAIQDALRDATRSAAQTFEYDQFAANTVALRNETEVKALARQLFTINLRQVNGLTQTPEQVAASVSWTVLTSGGSCAGSSFSQPALCATVDVPMNQLMLFGAWSTHLDSAATLDRTP